MRTENMNKIFVSAGENTSTTVCKLKIFVHECTMRGWKQKTNHFMAAFYNYYFSQKMSQ